MSREGRTLGEIRDEASKVVGLLLSSFDDLNEGVQVALDRGEQSEEARTGRRTSARA